MKKIFFILILSLSLILTYGCGKEEDLVENEKIDKDLKETIVREDSSEDLKEDVEDLDYKNDTDSIDTSNEEIIYVDDQYNFSLRLPSSWESNYTVEKRPWIDELDNSVCFDFNVDNISSNIFTIVVIEDSDTSDNLDNPFLTYIDESGGKTFFYIPSMEPSEELLLEENEDKLKTMSSMVEEVEEIIDSFQFEK